MLAIEEAAGLANRIRPVVQVLGGRFMTSPELAAVEAEVGLPPRSLYVRGRSAVLGDVPPKVAAELFGIFPHWLFDFVLPLYDGGPGRTRRGPRLRGVIGALVPRQPFGRTGAGSPGGVVVPRGRHGGRERPRAVHAAGRTPRARRATRNGWASP